MSRIFLDTNALIDLVLVRSADAHASMLLIAELCREETDELLVSTLSLKDASYIVESSRTYGESVPSAEKRREISAYLRNIAFEYCTVCPVDETVARRAHANTDERDYDDALIAESALVYGADVIVTSDKQAFKNARVPKMSPEDFAKALTVLRKRG